MSKKSLEVCVSISHIDAYDVSNKVTVVIDIFRATTCITVAVNEGASQIRVFDDIEKCVALRHNGFLLAGERRGLKIDGFDIGNSPLEYKTKQLKNKKLAITTTNGTKAILKTQNARKTLIGSFSNFSILKDYLKNVDSNILLLCAGRNGSINIEDTAFAGALVNHLNDFDGIQPLGDGAIIAEALWLKYKNNPSDIYKDATHGQRLLSKGFGKDLEFCLQKDSCAVIPECKGNVIEKLVL